MTREAPIHAFAVSAALTTLEVALDEPVVADAAPPAVEEDPEPVAPMVPDALGEADLLSVVPLLAAVEVLMTIAVPLTVDAGVVPLPRADVHEEYADAEAEM